MNNEKPAVCCSSTEENSRTSKPSARILWWKLDHRHTSTEVAKGKSHSNYTTRFFQTCSKAEKHHFLFNFQVGFLVDFQAGFLLVFFLKHDLWLTCLLLLKPFILEESPTSPGSCLDTPRDSQRSLAPPDPHAPVDDLLGLPQANAYKWPYTWVNVVLTPLTGVITPLWTGRGPPCRANCHFKQILFLHGLPCKISSPARRWYLRRISRNAVRIVN